MKVIILKLKKILTFLAIYITNQTYKQVSTTTLHGFYWRIHVAEDYTIMWNYKIPRSLQSLWTSK